MTDKNETEFGPKLIDSETGEPIKPSTYEGDEGTWEFYPFTWNDLFSVKSLGTDSLWGGSIEYLGDDE